MLPGPIWDGQQQSPVQTQGGPTFTGQSAVSTNSQSVAPSQLSAHHNFNAINWELDALTGSAATGDNDWSIAWLGHAHSTQSFASTCTGTGYDRDPAPTLVHANGDCHTASSASTQQALGYGSALTDTCEDDTQDLSPQAAQQSCETRRAKNRLAATKCRAKQKLRRDDLQTDFRSMSAQNKRLKREERLLRDAIAFLRNCALQHDATRCSCESLHRFNLMRAEYISMDMTRCKPGASMKTASGSERGDGSWLRPRDR